MISTCSCDNVSWKSRGLQWQVVTLCLVRRVCLKTGIGRRKTKHGKRFSRGRYSVPGFRAMEDSTNADKRETRGLVFLNEMTSSRAKWQVLSR